MLHLGLVLAPLVRLHIIVGERKTVLQQLAYAYANRHDVTVDIASLAAFGFVPEFNGIQDIFIGLVQGAIGHFHYCSLRSLKT